MCPGDVISAEATLDLRVGGAFRIVMKSKTAEYVHTGTYQIVDPPAKLVFTWTARPWLQWSFSIMARIVSSCHPRTVH